MYKVGDEVLVKGEITSVENISKCPNPYEVTFSNNAYSSVCVSEERIVQDKTYSQGLADAWELVTKLFDFELDEREEMLGYQSMKAILEDLTPEYVMDRIEAYEKEKEIKVGDVVTTSRHGATGVVVKLIADDRVNVLYGTGYVDGCYRKADCVKTNKHIDIESLLKKIGE